MFLSRLIKPDSNGDSIITRAKDALDKSSLVSIRNENEALKNQLSKLQKAQNFYRCKTTQFVNAASDQERIDLQQRFNEIILKLQETPDDHLDPINGLLKHFYNYVVEHLELSKLEIEYNELWSEYENMRMASSESEEK